MTLRCHRGSRENFATTRKRSRGYKFKNRSAPAAGLGVGGEGEKKMAGCQKKVCRPYGALRPRRSIGRSELHACRAPFFPTDVASVRRSWPPVNAGRAQKSRGFPGGGGGGVFLLI